MRNGGREGSRRPVPGCPQERIPRREVVEEVGEVAIGSPAAGACGGGLTSDALAVGAQQDGVTRPELCDGNGIYPGQDAVHLQRFPATKGWDVVMAVVVGGGLEGGAASSNFVKHAVFKKTDCIDLNMKFPEMAVKNGCFLK